MSTLLLFKLLLVPTLIAGITLAGRRWGPAVAGWLSAFPVVAGPILFFIAMEQGAPFAADAAVGTLSALLAIVAFGLGYAWAATRFNWAGSLMAAFAAYWVGVTVVATLAPGLAWSVAIAAVTLAIAPRLFPSRQRCHRQPASTSTTCCFAWSPQPCWCSASRIFRPAWARS